MKSKMLYYKPSVKGMRPDHEIYLTNNVEHFRIGSDNNIGEFC